MKSSKAEGEKTRRGRPKADPDDSPPRAKPRARSPARSPARTPTKRPKSPSRRSPARKSPARKAPASKSPSRKSPSRAAKDEAIKRAAYVDLKDSIIDERSLKRETFDSTNGVSLRERRPKSTTKTEEESPPKRTSSRLASTEATRKLFTPVNDLKPPRCEFGSPIIVALLMISSITIIFINAACGSRSCSITELPNISRLNKVEHWINFKSIAIVVVNFILNALPSLTRVGIFGSMALSFIATAASCVAVDRFYSPITQIIHENYLQLTVASFVFGILVVAFAYLKARKISPELRNPHANTGNFICDFFMGPEINPLIFRRINIKLVLFKIAVNTSLLINLLWIYRGLSIKKVELGEQWHSDVGSYVKIAQSVSINPTLIVFCTMQILYLADSIVRSASYKTTFEYLYEGVGWSIGVGYPTYPFICTLITKYILDRNVTLPNYILAIASLEFLIGFFIYVQSNRQKDIFRTNPNDPRISHLDTLPTLQGKRLLAGGWWGFVRHPNYLGDIIVQISWGIAVYNALPIYLPLITLALLLHRAHRDGVRCSERYGVAWKRYCQRVPNAIIPRVY